MKSLINFGIEVIHFKSVASLGVPIAVFLLGVRIEVIRMSRQPRSSRLTQNMLQGMGARRIHFR